ncbi:MAG TPA: FAD-linked oxidase C-terminal domain-containing protein [Thermoanaerobaculia bacterium]|nr:FAD-linked oxidase C-terminal domain-containing protein [Thermoanaerobaculia bacterium]
MTTASLLESLSRRLPREILLADADSLDARSADATEDLRARPELVVRPRSEAEVAELLSVARDLRIAVTPQGALTGLSGGALAVRGGVALDLTAMNEILEIDRENLFAVVQAGCVTETLQNSVEAAGLFYPPDPSSRGSCTIGGNIAENAGGPRAAKYGTTGRYVSGLRVVLPGGQVLPLGGKNRKDVAGYDLLPLFVGSEGTLGVVTQATLRLLPLPSERRLLWASFSREEQALAAVARLYAAGPEPSACEFMERKAAEVSAEQLSLALPADADAHLFVEVDGHEANAIASDAERIGQVLLDAGALDVRIAMNDREIRDFWRLRRAVGEAVKRLGPYAEEDCAVPRTKLPELLRRVREVAQRRGLTAVCYGHAADGNIHVNVVQPPGERERWLAERDAAVEEIFRAVVALGGTITGEHGVGLTQRAYLKLRHPPEVIAAMRAVKQIFDPDGILNPGKIF